MGTPRSLYLVPSVVTYYGSSRGLRPALSRRDPGLLFVVRFAEGCHGRSSTDRIHRGAAGLRKSSPGSDAPGLKARARPRRFCIGPCGAGERTEILCSPEKDRARHRGSSRIAWCSEKFNRALGGASPPTFLEAPRSAWRLPAGSWTPAFASRRVTG